MGQSSRKGSIEMARLIAALLSVVVLGSSALAQANGDDSMSKIPQDTPLAFAIVEYPGQLVVTRVKQVPVTVTKMVAVTRMRQETRTRLVNGAAKTYTVQVPYSEQVEKQEQVMHSVVQKETVNLETVQLTTLDGQILGDAVKLQNELQQPREAIVLLGKETLHPFYKRVLKPSVLVLRYPNEEPEDSASKKDLAPQPFKTSGGIK